LDFFGKYENKRFASLQHQLFKFWTRPKFCEWAIQKTSVLKSVHFSEIWDVYFFSELGFSNGRNSTDQLFTERIERKETNVKIQKLIDCIQQFTMSSFP
jgi:hypothetical protein